MTVVDEPETMEKVKEKYGEILAEMPVPDTGCVLAVVSGPALFIVAREASNIRPEDGPIILHGAGSWVTADKAVKFEADNPGKGFPCAFQDDQARVVLEDWYLLVT